jgi:hypothetical protein
MVLPYSEMYDGAWKVASTVQKQNSFMMEDFS